MDVVNYYYYYLNRLKSELEWGSYDAHNAHIKIYFAYIEK